MSDQIPIRLNFEPTFGRSKDGVSYRLDYLSSCTWRILRQVKDGSWIEVFYGTLRGLGACLGSGTNFLRYAGAGSLAKIGLAASTIPIEVRNTGPPQLASTGWRSSKTPSPPLRSTGQR